MASPANLSLPTIIRLRALCAEILAHAQAIERLKGEVASEVERARKRFGFTPFGGDRDGLDTSAGG